MPTQEELKKWVKDDPRRSEEEKATLISSLEKVESRGCFSVALVLLTLAMLVARR